jgi:hypothetical protein
LRSIVASSPAIFVLVLTFIVSLVSGHPAGLFLTNSARGIAVRFAVATLVLVLPIWLLPGFLALTKKITRNHSWLGRLVKVTATIDRNPSKSVAWILRPVQGMSLSLIFAERFLSFLESSIGASYAAILLRLSLFVIGGALTSVFLSIVWTLDDLGVRIYNVKTGEVRMAGTSVGIILPVITGAIGVSGLFHASIPVDAMMDLLEIVMILYPPYVLFTLLHHEFVVRKNSVLTRKLGAKRIETKVR